MGILDFTLWLTYSDSITVYVGDEDAPTFLCALNYKAFMSVADDRTERL